MEVAHRGRDPRLCLRRLGDTVPLAEWANEVLDAMSGVCEVLDAATLDRSYSNSLAAQREKVHDPELTPSARILADMRANGEGWFVAQARESLRLQRELEESDHEPFAAYLARYFAQEGG